MSQLCSVSDCDDPAKARGWCGKHYAQWRRHGALTTVKAPNGAGWTTWNGYRVHGDRREHLTIAERALGKPIPPGAEIHHVDGDPANNTPSNLVICPCREYHSLLHIRTRALDACGNANWRKCKRCKEHDDPTNMRRDGRSYSHRSCDRAAQRVRYQQRKAHVRPD